jgi:CMP-N,N'-diacetyllegionaminic acid synthase
MINGRSVLGLIPAKMNSIGLPNKNIKLLKGKPLVAWSVLSGLKSNYIDELIVSTDSQEIATIALDYGAKVPFLRPSNLATSHTPSVDVAKHALNFYLESQNKKFDYLALMEPTSPLRKMKDIDLMIEKLDSLSENFDAIVSIGATGIHPNNVKKIDGHKVERFCSALPITTRRQDDETVFFPLGIAYIAKVKTLFLENTFYPERLTYFTLSRNQCFEIDDFLDFKIVELLMDDFT